MPSLFTNPFTLRKDPWKEVEAISSIIPLFFPQLLPPEKSWKGIEGSQVSCVIKSRTPPLFPKKYVWSWTNRAKVYNVYYVLKVDFKKVNTLFFQLRHLYYLYPSERASLYDWCLDFKVSYDTVDQLNEKL
jgi:hypothetical protein